MSLETLKLNKQIISAMKEAGYLETKPVQEACVNRFAGGQDWIVVGPEDCGKTSAYVLSTIMKLKYAFENAPRALIMAANREKVEETVALFEQMAKYTDLRVLALYPGGGMQDQRDDLFAGIDIVVGTPDRISTIYINSGLNINKVQLFIIDDAEEIIKQGFQNIIIRLADCMPKCQKLAFSLVYHEKLEKLTSQMMTGQEVIEIAPELQYSGEYHIPEYYSVLNYKTKLNLLNLLVDREQFPKIVIFCNTRVTAGQLYNSISKRQVGQVGMMNPLYYNHNKVASIADFMANDSLTVLVLCSEDELEENLYDLPVVLQFDIPENDELLKTRLKKESEDSTNQLFILLVTDIELIIVKKLENELGFFFERQDLPIGLVVENNRNRKPDEEPEFSEIGSAFHKKKPANAKTVNLGIKDKIKLYGKAYKKGKGNK